MNLNTLSLKQHGLVVSLVTALWATACGGSFSGGASGGTGAASAASGTGAASGAGGGGAGGFGATGGACDVGCPAIGCLGVSVTYPGDCCPTCLPSGGSGGVSAGGTTGVGGGCAGVACAGFTCAVGYKSVLLPDACCPTCVPDDTGGSGGIGGCAAVDCAFPNCPPGYTVQQQPDACCQHCVPDSACTKGQQGYETLRSQLLAQPGAVACKVDKDCALLGGNAYCGAACSQTPVNAAAAQSIDTELESYAKDNCSSCTPLLPPCVSPQQPVCLQGQCAGYALAGG